MIVLILRVLGQYGVQVYDYPDIKTEPQRMLQNKCDHTMHELLVVQIKLVCCPPSKNVITMKL